MSEKIFVWLLRLYPKHFRDSYGQEALLLLHDRVRDEKGLLFRCRLWFDLFADLAVSLPREYRNKPQVTMAAPLRPCLNGVPTFQMLEAETPDPGSLFMGGALTLVICTSILFLLGHKGARLLLPDADTIQYPNYFSSTAKPSTDETATGSRGGQPASRDGNRTRGSAAKREFEEFDVARISESKASDPSSVKSKMSPMPADASPWGSDLYNQNGGYFQMRNLSLLGYIAFAYELNMDQTDALQKRVPDWVRLTKYDIEAWAQGHPHPEDTRSMLRALLRRPFKLRMHIETQPAVAARRYKAKLALKSVRERELMEVYVLDQVERPSAN